MKKLCRICLKSLKESISLFNTTLPNSEIVLATFISRITNLEININDSQPREICEQCYKKLDEAFKLISQCERSDKIFKESLAQSDEDDDDKPLIYLAIKSEPWETVETQMDEDTKDGILFDPTSPLNAPIESDQKYKCTVCNNSFRSNRLLRYHNQRQHTDLKRKNGKKHSTMSRDKKSRKSNNHCRRMSRKEFHCKMCLKKFAYLGGFKRHTECDPGEQPHVCSICAKSFDLPTCLSYHNRRYHRNVNCVKRTQLCNTCGQTFSSSTTLKYHIRIHTNERPFMCQVCGASFPQNKNLIRHEKMHSGLLSVLCPVCGKKMSTCNLLVHMRSHTGERPFLCTTCGKSFVTKQLLKRHNRVHTGEKPYVCNVCGRAFNQSNALKSHKKTHIRQGDSHLEVVKKIEDEKKSEFET